jgi:hypothetical protein
MRIAMNGPSIASSQRGHGAVLLMLLSILGGGAWLTIWTARQADAELRERLLLQATAVARQVDAADVAALAFDASVLASSACARR